MQYLKEQSYYHQNKERCKRQQAEYRAKNKEKKKAYMEKYYHENKEILCDKSTKFRKENREEVLVYLRKYYAENKEKFKQYRLDNFERIKKREAEWAKNNKDKVINHSKTRRAKKIKATVAWRNQFFIDEMYDLARLRTKVMGVDWHVDHIIPLKNSMVCGLHCEDNLRVITATENLMKGNSFVIS